MLVFVVRRLAGGIVLLLVVSALTFAMLFSGGETIARRLLGQNATDEIVARRTAELGLDQPVWTQYADWLRSAVTGDFGRSWFNGQNVSSSIVDRLGVSLSLVIAATLLSALIATVLGILAARRGGWAEGLLQVVSVVGFAIPGFLIAVYLVLAFAINLKLFRATGYVPPTESLGGWAVSITLPVIALSIGGIAAIAQQVRGSVLDILARDYVRTLRSRGLPERTVLYTHVLRNAGGPALSVLAVQFIGMLGGVVIIERVFALPGIGQLTVEATTAGDIPVVMGVVVASAVIVIIVNLLIDIAQAALNPKVRLG